MAFAWSRLFATRYSSKLAIATSPRAELDAVAAGKKAMSVFDAAEYDALLPLALARDLVVVVQRERGSRERSLFVARPDQLWRIPAWVALRETAFIDGRWSNAAEAQTSLLLGYTATQRTTWIADAKQRHAAWGCGTIYTLLTADDKRAVAALGNRCLVAGLELAFDRTGNGLVPDALARIPTGHTLARAGLAWAAFRTVFGRPTRGPVAITAMPRVAAKVNAALQSNIEILTSRGWR